ncbi:hypothetical protein [Spongiactinospora sp. TRM90649]|nr:hypothetical protein [Spongiactinospora sp. TRM90649]MDF5752435.1 hypothetical protein [Spongiactinospora sp. TRM90649]
MTPLAGYLKEAKPANRQAVFDSLESIALPRSSPASRRCRTR